jgi:hypothetical protein
MGLSRMGIVVRGGYADGTLAPLGAPFSDLLDAVTYALETANQCGVAIDGHPGQPQTIDVFEDGVVHLALKVFPGGLAPR